MLLIFVSYVNFVPYMYILCYLFMFSRDRLSSVYPFQHLVSRASLSSVLYILFSFLLSSVSNFVVILSLICWTISEMNLSCVTTRLFASSARKMTDVILFLYLPIIATSLQQSLSSALNVVIVERSYYIYIQTTMNHCLDELPHS